MATKDKTAGKALEDFTLEELQEQIAKLQQVAEERLQAEKGEMLGHVRDAILKYGFTAQELGFRMGGAPTVRRARATHGQVSGASVRYQDDAGNKWVGRGPRPAWLKAHLDAGRKLEEFLVQPS